MSEKYYTPTIEEFYVGFEYEVKWYNGKEDVWSKRSITDWYQELENESRVKYLDKEDIESLGWKHVGGKMLNGAMQNYAISDRPYILYYAENNKTYLSIDIGYEGTQIFRGAIKNKSELKKLMKQLGI